MNITEFTEMGAALKKFTHKEVVGTFAEGNDWVTLYHIESRNPGKGEAQEAIKELINYSGNKKFGSTPALNPVMRHILRKFNVEEYY